MITYHGERRTPKELAALLVRQKLQELPDDWTGFPEGMTGSEKAAVIDQIKRYQERFFRILSVIDGDEGPSVAPEGSAA